MEIPGYVRAAMDRLEQAGFEAWAVGGCIRDGLLGKTPQDWDLCTSALPEQTLQVFSDSRVLTNGLKHGTVTVLSQAPLEITTFRTEGGYHDHRHPDWVRFVPDLTQDLARRDFTVNAMAYSPRRGLADPFGGRADLEFRVLRAVGDPAARFQEDGLRILRGARFSTAYGLTPETATERAMLALTPLLDGLSRERVYSELCKLLLAADTGDLLRWSPILCRVIPELTPLVGFDQRTPYHSFDIYGHTARVVAACPRTLPLRWAALLHDIGKPLCFRTDDRGVGHFKGHAAAGAPIAAEILTRLRAPKALVQRVELLVRYHSISRDCSTEKAMHRLLSRLGQEPVEQLAELDRADSLGKHPLPQGQTFADQPDPPAVAGYRALLQAVLSEQPCLGLRGLAVHGNDLLALGFTPGPALGRTLNALLDRVLSGALSNEREALLAAALAMKPD